MPDPATACDVAATAQIDASGSRTPDENLNTSPVGQARNLIARALAHVHGVRRWGHTPRDVRALGLDVGSKTIGVALTDEAGIAAHPLTVLARVGHAGDAATIARLVAEHAVTDVVVGMPYELSGRIGHRARQVQVFIKALVAALPAAVAHHAQDERFTTAEAQRAMIDADVSRARRREVIDQQAAALILQTWLDGRRRAP